MANLVRTLATLTGGALCSILVTVPAPSVSALTLSSTVQQSGSNQSTRSPTPLTGSTTPYDFSGNGGYTILTSIQNLSVTLTVDDGDTSALDINNPNQDFNNLFLALDGINTGIALNGFRNNQINTLTITGAPSNQNTANQLLSALKADGQLLGSVIDTTLTNNDNRRRFANTFTTTLEITGVAVPFKISPGLGSLVVGAWGAIAYFKSKEQKRKFFGSTFSKS